MKSIERRFARAHMSVFPSFALSGNDRRLGHKTSMLAMGLGERKAIEMPSPGWVARNEQVFPSHLIWTMRIAQCCER